jgi:translation elongation factor EF-Tu-like GTPase
MSSFPPAAFIRVRLQMCETDKGGRHRPIHSGYRPNCWIGRTTAAGEREYSDAAVLLESEDLLRPGEVGIARLQPARPEYWQAVDVGSRIEVCEGHRVVAVADVLELFPDLGQRGDDARGCAEDE